MSRGFFHSSEFQQFSEWGPIHFNGKEREKVWGMFQALNWQCNFDILFTFSWKWHSSHFLWSFSKIIIYHIYWLLVVSHAFYFRNRMFLSSFAINFIQVSVVFVCIFCKCKLWPVLSKILHSAEWVMCGFICVYHSHCLFKSCWIMRCLFEKCCMVRFC